MASRSRAGAEPTAGLRPIYRLITSLLMLSYPQTDELFEGGTPPSAWFYAFEEDRNAAVQDLLFGAADLGPFQTLDPWAVAIPWLQGFSDKGFPADFDAALAEWI